MVRKPTCLPEQLLWMAVGSPPPDASAVAADSDRGTWAPHSRASESRPSLASHADTPSTWPRSPSWLEQARASSTSVRPKASAAPVDTRGRAWIGLMAERGMT